jgi:glycine C-acetyltransferase
LVGAEVLVLEDTELQSSADRCKGRRRVCFVIESVSALTGAVRDIVDDLAFAERIGAWVIVDESAALGIRGLRGAGSADVVRWSPALLARIASFHLTLGFAGTGVVGPIEFRELLLRRSRFLRYEAPEPAALLLGVEAALSAAELSVLSRELLGARAKFFAESLARQGWSVPCGGEVPIVSIAIDSFKGCCELQSGLLQRGFLTEALPGKSRGRDGGFLRVLLSTRHSEADIEALLESFSVVRERLKADSRVV